MSGSVVLDLVIGIALLLYAVNGYRSGLLASVLSLVGFLGGGLLGLWLLPLLTGTWEVTRDSVAIRTVVLVGGTFLLASLGQGIGVAIGRRVRRHVHARPARTLDSVLGAAASVVVLSALVWFIAGAARGALPASMARAIGDSRVLATIDEVMPQQTGQVFSDFQDMLDRHGFPRVFAGVQPEPIRPVAPPDGSVAKGRGVAAAADSIVKITGTAPSCSRAQEGSGWVVAPQRVVTNAHVVAGVHHPTVRIGGTGRSYDGVVVVFDPERDLAVIAVPGLPARPLPLGGTLQRGDGAVIAGFPLNGPYRLDPARVRGLLTARGADIYGKPGVNRHVYSLNGRVQPGNSGGPLLSPTGQVVGTVFAKSLEDANTGYALTLEETRPVLREAGASAPVSTGQCTSLASH